MSAADASLSLFVLGALTAAAPGQVVVGTGEHLAPEALALPGVPGGMLVADVDADGLPDVLVADGSDELLLLRAAQTAGLLAPEPIASPVPFASALRGGDLDHDGDLDLVLADPFGFFSPALGVVLGDGLGAFGGGGLLATSSGGAHDLELADFDGDGALDLVYSVLPASFVVSGVKTLSGDGTGGFGAEQLLPPLAYPLSAGQLVLAELSGDAWLDVAVNVSSLAVDEVRLFAGLGGGSFAPSIPLLDTGAELAVADLDADARADLIALHTADVHVLYQSSPGVLEPPVVTSFGAPALPTLNAGLVVGDIDGNGVPDVLASTDYGLMQLFGTALDGLHAGTPSDLGDLSGALALADIDRDGRTDALVGRSDGSASGGLLEVVRGDGQGGFVVAPQTGAPSETLSNLAAGDFDGDGLADVASRASGGLPAETGLAIFRGAGPAGFLPAEVVPDVPFGVVVDLDEDGRSDVAATAGSDDAVSVWLATGGLSFAAPVSYPGGDNPIADAAADLDADGHADVVSLGGTYPGPALIVLRGDGAGHLGPPIPSPDIGLLQQLAFADVNLDGLLDAVSCFGKEVFAYLGDGTGLLAFGPLKNVGVSGLQFIATGDVDGDGDADLAASTSGGTLVIVPNDAGTFGAASTQVSPLFSSGLSLADMDGDGALDALSSAPSAGVISILDGDGAGGFPTIGRHHVLETVSDAVVLDEDGDGLLDVVALGKSDGPVIALLRASPTPWANLGFALAGGGPAPALLGSGSLLPHSAGALDIVGTAPGSAVSLFFGLDAVYAPFHGGTLVPAGLMRFVYPTSATGDVHLAWQDFPQLPAGLVVYAQAWSADTAAPGGLVASNALSATVP